MTKKEFQKEMERLAKLEAEKDQKILELQKEKDELSALLAKRLREIEDLNRRLTKLENQLNKPKVKSWFSR